MDNNTAAVLVNVVIVCIILVIHARKPAHGGTVYHSVQHAFVCDVGFVLADNTADGGCRCRIVRIDKPLAGGGSVDCTAERVKACQTAQITGGTGCLAVVAAAQGDKQIIGGKTALAVDVPIALCRHSVNALEARVGRACGQLCRHAVDAGIGIFRTQPFFNLCNKGGFCCVAADQRFFAAAARDSAVVGARDAAHKAVTRRNDAARVAAALGGDIAVGDFVIVAARNAAHMAGTGELFVCGLGRGDVADTADLQFDVFDLTALDFAVVQTGNAAHRAAGAACTGGDKAVRVRVAAHRAGIGTLLQGTVVLACDAAQICIFIKILCKVQPNVGAADRAVLRGAAHRAAQRDGVGARAQTVVQRQRAVLNAAAGDGTIIHARKAADGDRRGAEPHVGLLRQLHIADGRALAVVRRNSADALRCAGDRAVAYAAVVFQPAVLADGAEVRGRDAARRAVGRGDGGLDLHILNQRVFIIIARDAARLAVGGVDLILGMDAGADFAARGVLARNTARILCAGAHRGVILHTGDFGTVRTGHAARVVGGSDAAPDRAGGVFSAVNTALIRIDTGHTARIAGSGDTALQLAGQRDIADVGTGHAARVPVGLYRRRGGVPRADDEALACRSVTAQVDARNAADIAVAAHGAALRRVGRLNKTAVDARNAAQIGIPVFTVAEGRLHAAAGDRALVPARKAARGALVSHCAVVCAVFQRCVGCGIADDTARQCAARGAKVIAAIGQRVQRYAAFKRAVVGRVQAADGQGVLRCAVGCILNRQLRVGVVCADDAADVDVGLQVELVLETGQGDCGIRFRFRVGAVGQHAGALVNRRQQRLQRAACGLGRQQTVVADDAARDGVGLDAARGHICYKRAVARHGEAAHRQVGADDAADKLLTRHAADLHSGGGQFRRAVQADHAADSLARRHDLAADGQVPAGGVGDFRLFIVITGHAAHVVIAVQDGTQRRGAVLIPRHNAVFAVAARDAADVVGAAAQFL